MFTWQKLIGDMLKWKFTWQVRFEDTDSYFLVMILVDAAITLGMWSS